MKRIVSIVLLLYFSSHLSAQEAQQYAFTRYNISNGLASNSVNNLVQDQKGFIWLATINGLQRYDGHKFFAFKHQANTPQTLPADNITKIYLDIDNRLWVATSDNKVGIFNTDNGKYQEVPIRWNTSARINITKNFFETRDGKLMLFMGYEGLYMLDPKLNAFVSAEHIIPAPPGWKRTDVKEDPYTHRFWIACDSGLAVFDPATRHLSYRGHNVDKETLIQKFGKEVAPFGLNVSDSNLFIFGVWLAGEPIPRLHFYDKRKDQHTVYNLSQELKIGYHEILGNLRQQNGRIWFYGMPFITEYTGQPQPFRVIRNEYKDEQSIKFDKANSMFEDREKNLWIATDNGVFLFNPDAQVFNSYSLLRPNERDPVEVPTQSVLNLNNGQIWVGSWGGGLYCYDRNFTPLPAPPSLQMMRDAWSIWCMWQHHASGQVWMGLQSGVLVIYDPVTGKSKKFSPAVFENRTIRQITEDKLGNLWFGTQSGHIIKWDPNLAGDEVEKGFTVITKAERVHKLFTDQAGFVWAGTFGSGLFRINPVNNQIKIYTKTGPPGKRLFADNPYDLLQYNDSMMIIANGAVDVLNVKTGAVNTINTEGGLPSNDVVCLQKDATGMIWLGMVNGLCRMNLEKKIFIYYDRRDGINFDNFNPAGAFQLPEGNLVFTTDHNFLVFDPLKMVQKNPPPDVKILDFKVANRSFPVDSLKRLNKITLEFNKNSISIDFGTLSYLRNNKKVFYYQLEKVDDDWVVADDRHQAFYNYLAPGTYTFKVKCVNGYGIWSNNVTKLIIYVQSPFWKTWWFYSIILLLAVAVLYWIDRERVKRLFTLQQVRTEIADNLHQDINTTLNNIHLLSEIAKMKADKDVTKSKEYIDQINAKSRRMIDNLDDMMWSINPQNDSMLKTLERMQEFGEGLKNTHSCEIKLVVDDRVRSLKLNMRSRHEIFFIFKEALIHLIQHSKCSDTIIHIDLVKSHLQIKIHDNGSGVEANSMLLNGGIKEMEKRAQLLNAILDIQVDKKGTALILSVPI